MSARRYYFGAEKRYNTSGDDDVYNQNYEPLYPCNGNNNDNDDANNRTEQEQQPEPEPDGDKDDDSEFLQDVPYSSSSIDRSSIGSIPWADDAIKKNKMDWEHIDRLLSGEEALQDVELELRKEIFDWQHKFPCLLTHKAIPFKQQSLDYQNRANDESGDIDSISNLSLNSLDDYDEGDEDDDGFLTPTVERQRAEPMPPPRRYPQPSQNLVKILDRDLHIDSIALKLLKREHIQRPPDPITPQSATISRSRLRMPPILNVLDSSRRFRGLLNNRSFVQLTQVQQQQHLQPKSAALTYTGSAERRQTGIRSAWSMPMAASRFLNNKHAIVLPSLNRQRDFSTTVTTSSQSISSGGGAHNSNRASLGRTRQGTEYSVQYGLASTTNSNTPSTGRSISAAIHHPRSEFVTSSAFYIPYSASKFKAFK